MIIKLLTEHHLEFLRLKGGCRGSSGSTHVKMPHCWKSHALAHLKLSRCYLDCKQMHLRAANLKSFLKRLIMGFTAAYSCIV